jgi:hypothetical protein
MKTVVEKTNLQAETVQIPIDFIPPQFKARVRRMKLRHYLFVLFFAVGMSGVVAALTAQQTHERYLAVHGPLALHGGVALNATELVSVVRKLGAPVYWMGAKSTYRYVLDASIANQVSLRYLPANEYIDTAPERDVTVTSFQQKDAYSIVFDAGGDTGTTSSVNGDGNSIYFSSADPYTVYMGISGIDVQVQIFDPHAGVAAAIALEKHAIQEIM